MGIQWAPLNIPLRRRVQTFTVGVIFCCLYCFGLFPQLICALILCYGNIYVKVILILYAAIIYYDRERAKNCWRGSGIKWMRNNFFCKFFREYFPIELIKTAELPPNRNYILGCFPHGVISVGLMCNMCCDISKWEELFPKVRPNLATLAIHFNTPIWREVIQAWGMTSSSKKSIINNVTTSNDPNDPINSDGYTSNAFGIVVGGAEEALDTKPRTYVITIKKRKGFIRIAIQTGTPIVPVFSFGEVDLFDQASNPPGSSLRKFQIWVKNAIGMPPLILLGRGFFQYTFGVLPHRRRIVQVVGAPIEVQKCDNPLEEDVDKLHQLFMDKLNELFETHKSKYIENSDDIFLIMK